MGLIVPFLLLTCKIPFQPIHFFPHRHAPSSLRQLNRMRLLRAVSGLTENDWLLVSLHDYSWALVLIYRLRNGIGND
jgi:hypothetical protein